MDESAQVQLKDFVNRNMNSYFEFVEEVLEKEQSKGDTIILVRALDRFYRKLQALNTLVVGVDFVELVFKQVILFNLYCNFN